MTSQQQQQSSTDPVKTIAIFFGHVASNVGDLAINTGQSELLQKIYPAAVIKFVTLNASGSKFFEHAESSFGSEAEVQVTNFSTKNTSALEYALDPALLLKNTETLDADLIVIAAGEHLFSYKDEDNFEVLFWRTLPVFSAQATGKKCIIMPSTFGPFQTSLSKKLIFDLLAFDVCLSARERRSQRLLNTLSGSESVGLFPDPAFFLPSKAPHKLNENKALAFVLRAKNWGIRQRSTRKSEINVSDSWFQCYMAIIEGFLKKDYRTCKFLVQTVNDKFLAEKLIAELDLAPSKKEKTFIVEVKSIEHYQSILDGVDVVVASRFHAIIFAVLRAKNVFGLYFEEHGHKMPGLFEFFGYPNLCLNISRLKPSRAATLMTANMDDNLRHESLQRTIEKSKVGMIESYGRHCEQNKLTCDRRHNSLIEIAVEIDFKKRESELRRRFNKSINSLRQKLSTLENSSSEA
ncbi:MULTISPECIES: polysaccharide pyruvyl transferase family protein [unclassified Pseudovibrio]|uniref:polysaccharide pyruvyl transferase family protein n=1 Tax=unclassified Pseudovibrio TaxID=2627060 RepID=UPI0007AE9D7C|nr:MULTISPECIES: polysaccharide pyruvyl transferase family protein [unclassified Pseudovibrio]KZL17219.1 Polysaccharide pyruvyl transferase [Pseudovibrio sp. WM33]KZL22826.1 Polysaccharide pyruvyl transferase [Pseudovibrio sp. Ad37]